MGESNTRGLGVRTSYSSQLRISHGNPSSETQAPEMRGPARPIRHCPSAAASNLRHAIHIKAMAPVGLYAIFGLRMLSCHARNLDLGTLNATVLRGDVKSLILLVEREGLELFGTLS
jgi:hypothetical protein